MSTVEDMPGAAETSRVSHVITAVTGLIREEGLEPGDPLPSELALSRSLHVSRTVVREAYRSLAALRLIELGTGRRARVAALDYGTMALLIEHGVQTHQISVQQIYDVRRTIETRTAALAALRRSQEEAHEILAHARAMDEVFEDAPAVMEHDIAFHETIASASRNPVFALIVGAFHGVTRQTWPIGWRSRATDDDRRRNVACHVAIGEAIGAGDPQAATGAMAEHFDDSVKALVAAGIG